MVVPVMRNMRDKKIALLTLIVATGLVIGVPLLGVPLIDRFSEGRTVRRGTFELIDGHEELLPDGSGGWCVATAPGSLAVTDRETGQLCIVEYRTTGWNEPAEPAGDGPLQCQDGHQADVRCDRWEQIFVLSQWHWALAKRRQHDDGPDTGADTN